MTYAANCDAPSVYAAAIAASATSFLFAYGVEYMNLKRNLLNSIGGIGDGGQDTLL